MGKILPLLLAIVGLAAGVGGGMVLRPPSADIASEFPCGDIEHADATMATNISNAAPDTAADPDYVKLNNQFVIPVVDAGSVRSLIVISLSLEMKSGGPELVYKREPKLRDSFLQVLFDHANTGGFDGNFTSGRKMGMLRTALREAAVKALGPIVTDVLIADVVRQDV